MHHIAQDPMRRQVHIAVIAAGEDLLAERQLRLVHGFDEIGEAPGAPRISARDIRRITAVLGAGVDQERAQAATARSAPDAGSAGPPHSRYRPRCCCRASPLRAVGRPPDSSYARRIRSRRGETPRARPHVRARPSHWLFAGRPAHRVSSRRAHNPRAPSILWGSGTPDPRLTAEPSGPKKATRPNLSQWCCGLRFILHGDQIDRGGPGRGG